MAEELVVGKIKTTVDVEKKDKPLTAKVLSDQLAGTLKERLEEEKTIFLRMTPGQRPEVTFTGFWNGRFVRAAMDSIAKGYRLRRYKPSRPKEVERRDGNV